MTDLSKESFEDQTRQYLAIQREILDAIPSADELPVEERGNYGFLIAMVDLALKRLASWQIYEGVRRVSRPAVKFILSSCLAAVLGLSQSIDPIERDSYHLSRSLLIFHILYFIISRLHVFSVSYTTSYIHYTGQFPQISSSGHTASSFLSAHNFRPRGRVKSEGICFAACAPIRFKWIK